MTILLVLISFYILTLLIGKSVERVNYLGYGFVGIITAIEVGLVIYLLFVMEAPKM